MNAGVTNNRYWPRRMRVSMHDRLESLLAASLIIIGLMVSWLALVWLNSGEFDPARDARLRELPAVLADAPDTDIPELLVPDPQVMADSSAPGLDEILQSLDLAVGALGHQLAREDSGFRGTWQDDGRNRGSHGYPGTDIPRIVPDAARWVLTISASSRVEYTSILAFFDIEPGVVDQLSNRIRSIRDPEAADPTVEVTQRQDETRLFFVNRAGRLRNWDRAIVEQAGLDVQNTMIGHFCPESLRQSLLALEAEVYSADGKTLAEVQRTQFAIRETGNQYEFYVSGIEYRDVRRAGDETGNE